MKTGGNITDIAVNSLQDQGTSQDFAKTNSTGQSKQIGLFKATFLVARSFIGVGILAQPNLNHKYGAYSLLITYPIVAGVIIYLLSRLPKVANDIDYTGDSLEEFVEIVVGVNAGRIATLFIQMFNISVSVCAAIFAGKFFFIMFS